MKKLFLSIIAMATAFGATAQINPIDIYPHKPGDIIVNKCYDGQGNLRATMKSTIAAAVDEEDVDDYVEVSFTVTDAKNEVVDYGTIYAVFDGKNFELSMSNRPTGVNITNYLSLNSKLMNDFLDYPDPNMDDQYIPGPFHWDPADYVIKVGPRNRNFISVKVYNRDWTGDEKVTTPAGEFNASKINFTMEIYNNDTKQTDKYKGTEWYAVNKGIVRTEIHDQKGNIVDYSEVTEMYRQ